MRLGRLLALAAAVVIAAALAAGKPDPAARPPLPGSPPAKAAAPATVLIAGVPHVRQKPDFCGEACAAAWLAKLGRSVDQDWVFDQSDLDPREGRGCFTKELAAALAAIGFRTGPVWHEIPADTSDKALADQFAALLADLKAGVPSIVCMHFDERSQSSEHFRLVLGYDAAADEVVYHEPAEADGAYRRMPRDVFLRLWPLKYQTDRWLAIRLRLEPATLKDGRASTAHTAADFAQHFITLKGKLPAGFTAVVTPPFVVIGDESPATVAERAEGTVKWAVGRLKAAYFQRDPPEILDIWLFKDRESYEHHTQALFGRKPDTPFGYYSHTQRALVMNIATGGGTLVHEIVHPFMDANFPACPAWFNEGLGSLYEQSGQRAGRIVGFTNWRLAGLQDAIRVGRVPSFKTLLATTDHEFYERDPGTNYAQARYLCYYLQERGLLEKFYHRFRAAAEADPGGYATLQDLLGQTDMDAFQQEWEEYVLALRFP